MRLLCVCAIALLAACVEPPADVPVVTMDRDTGGVDDAGPLDTGTASDASIATDQGQTESDGGGDLGNPVDMTADGGDPADAGDGGTPDGCSVDLPFEPNFQFSNTLWVDPSSIDVIDRDGSEASPFSSLGQALAAATPGTQIRLRAGTYSGNAFVEGFADGTEQAPYGIVGEDGVVLTNPSGNPLQLKSPKWVLLENLTIQNVQGGHGMNIDDSGVQDSAHHVVLRNVEISNVGPETSNRCIRLTGVNDFIVEDSRFTGCQGHAIQISGGLRGTVRNSTFENTPNRGLSIEAGSADILIHGNVFENVGDRDIHVGGGGSLRRSDVTYAAERIRVVANVFIRSTGVPLVDADCHECLYANNLIWQPAGRILRIVRENSASLPGAGGRFMNNIVTVRTRPQPWIEVGSGPEIATYRVTHNLWHVEDDAGFAGPVDGAFETTDDDVFGDPSYDGLNGMILPSSRAVGQGRRNVVAGLPDGFGNCFSDPPSIGPHEPTP